MRRGPLLWTVVLVDLVIVALALLVMLRHRQAVDHAARTAALAQAALPRPRFHLQDCHGHDVSEATWHGRVLLVYFGYSFCPDVCPTELGYQARLLKALGQDARDVVPLFITIDPARDTPAHLAAYVALFDPRIIGLTGSEAQVRQAADAFGAWYQRASPDGQRVGASAGSGTSAATASLPPARTAAATTGTAPGFYLMDHSSSTYLIDRGGRLQGTIDPQGSLAEALRAVRACL